MQGGCVSHTQIRCRLTHLRDQGDLQLYRLIEALLRTALYPLVHEGGQHRIVAGNAQLFQVMEGAAHVFGAQA